MNKPIHCPVCKTLMLRWSDQVECPGCGLVFTYRRRVEMISTDLGAVDAALAAFARLPAGKEKRA